MMVNLFLLLVFTAVTLLLTREGLWSALIMLLNVLVAASMATAWHGSLAVAAETYLPSYVNLLDFLSMWTIFCVVLLVLRETTDRVSHTKVKFLRQVEMFGAPLAAAAVGWVMIAFTAASLHAAAVPRDVVQPTPESRMLFGLAPDRKWLSWVRNASRSGPFAVAGRPFDKDADFIVRHAHRRLKLEGADALRVNPK
jgi:hypothetical protein